MIGDFFYHIVMVAPPVKPPEAPYSV
ncbi:uncharacterized protein G2W53_016482 [Senna tora]|uniref:Uncharacterized protein n=1 Tax=Senna tora TaxID=362788 RepID=A0A834WLJ8_9FABA|nr:uncharacterized protein G2W53_016482 [Senna tora]